MKKILGISLAATLALGSFLIGPSKPTVEAKAPKKVTLLNVSYDPTREFYEQYNKLFAQNWGKKNGYDVTVQQSHGGSGKQARSVIDGLKADVVTLALEYDIDEIQKAGLINPGWRKEFKYNSAPYTSTIVFLVRKGNPEKIQDWDDLTRRDINVVTPNPKTSGGARYNFLAAWAYAKDLYKGDETKIKKFIKNLYSNVEVLDSGARGSTTTFSERGIGDVLITWENEAYLVQKEFASKGFQIVYPSQSILAEPPVAIVDKVVKDKGTGTVAKAYLNYLYSKEAQILAAKNHYRPADPAVFKQYGKKFKKIQLFNVDKEFGGWAKAQAKFFNDGGVFDEIYLKK
ncbi:MAG: sulfate ABC transporter substrate-binding protein [Bacilli bacterium]